MWELFYWLSVLESPHGTSETLIFTQRGGEQQYAVNLIRPWTQLPKERERERERESTRAAEPIHTNCWMG